MSVNFSKQILTNSSMTDFKNCRRKWYYRNVLQLVPIKRKESLSIGSAFHKGVETNSIEQALIEFDKLNSFTQEEANQTETNKVIVRAMLEGFFSLFKPFEEIQNEMQFSVPIINPETQKKSRTFDLNGKVDGLAKIGNEYWLVEYKTVSVIDKNYIDRLLLDTQVTTYIYALQRLLGITITGVIYRVARKPSIRQTQKETLLQYQQRLIDDYKARPEFYFHEEKLYRSQDDLEEFEAELWEITQTVLHCARSGGYYKNTSRCVDWGQCQYAPLCLKNPDAQMWYEVKEPHQELKEEKEAI